MPVPKTKEQYTQSFNDSYCRIPMHMWEGLYEYCANGRPTGSFLTAVLENDLYGAVGRADMANKVALPNYAAWLHTYAPSGCFGNKQMVSEWIEMHKKERENAA